MICETCARWQPYTQIFYDPKVDAVRELELMGCELRRTKATCDGCYVARGSQDISRGIRKSKEDKYGRMTGISTSSK